KRHIYLLPLLPGFAIMIATWIAGPWGPERARWESIWHRGGLSLFAVLPVGSWGAALYYAVLQGNGVLVASIGIVVSVLTAVAALAYALRSRGERLPEIAIALLILAYGAVLSPSLWAVMEKEKGHADFESMLDARIGKDDLLYLYGPGEQELGIVCFRLKRIVPLILTPEELPLVLRPSSGNRLLISEKAYSALRASDLIPSTVAIAAQSKLRRKTQYLLVKTAILAFRILVFPFPGAWGAYSYVVETGQNHSLKVSR
ncbi:MAG: hypothetical protein P8123_10740, partial [bacterium]